VKTIQLTQGKVALVDDEDYEQLSKHKWHAHKGVSTWYARRNEPTGLESPKQRKISMHMLLAGTPPGMETDHVDGDGLNNQRRNLRVADKRMQAHNRVRKCSRQTTSRFRGVHWHKQAKKWRASIKDRGTIKTLGQFHSEHAAAQAYDDAGFSRNPGYFTPNFPRISIEIDRSV
jgi:hypothetical protein